MSDQVITVRCGIFLVLIGPDPGFKGMAADAYILKSALHDDRAARHTALPQMTVVSLLPRTDAVSCASVYGACHGASSP